MSLTGITRSGETTMAKPAAVDLKGVVAQAALREFPESGVVAMGTGSTVAALLDAIGASAWSPERIGGYRVVSTSDDTTLRCGRLGMVVVGIWPSQIPAGFDGADKVLVDDAGQVLLAVKGGGGAHDIEKQVANLVADGIHIMVDHSKVIPAGGEGSVTVPLSVSKPALTAVLEQLPGRLEVAPGKIAVRYNPPGGVFGLSIDGQGNVVVDVTLSPKELIERARVFDELLVEPSIKAHGVFGPRYIRKVLAAEADGTVRSWLPKRG